MPRNILLDILSLFIRISQLECILWELPMRFYDSFTYAEYLRASWYLKVPSLEPSFLIRWSYWTYVLLPYIGRIQLKVLLPPKPTDIQPSIDLKYGKRCLQLQETSGTFYCYPKCFTNVVCNSYAYAVGFGFGYFLYCRATQISVRNTHRYHAWMERALPLRLIHHLPQYLRGYIATSIILGSLILHHSALSLLVLVHDMYVALPAMKSVEIDKMVKAIAYRKYICQMFTHFVFPGSWQWY